MIHDVGLDLCNPGRKWYLLRLSNVEPIKHKLAYLMDCTDDPLGDEICLEKYVNALIAFATNKDYNAFSDENDGQWLEDPEVKAVFLADAMHFIKFIPLPNHITKVNILYDGDIMLEY